MSTIEDHPELPDGLTVVSRRALLGGSAAAGAIAFLSSPLSGVAGAAAAQGRQNGLGKPADAGKPNNGNGGAGTGSSALGFAAVAITEADEVTVPAGYITQVLIPWGDPIVPDGPEFNEGVTNETTAAQQAEQFGMAHDGMTFFPTSRDRGLLVVNHEAIDALAILFDAPVTWSPVEVLKSQNAHGVAVCEIERQRDGSWELVGSAHARRITMHTEMEVTGPAAGHALLKTAADPTGRKVLGTLNNCGNGETPWGTYLTCEENFNGYFGTEDAAFNALRTDKKAFAAKHPLYARYGVERGWNSWWKGDPRFDLVENPNEPNRFGWIVEIDPKDPSSTPKKRSALGRVKHENASFAEAADGRAVVYTGDDERFQYLYKYVSAEPWRSMVGKESPLDRGTLYVARFDDDGTGEWLPLSEGTVPGYGSLADILVDTRGAATAVKATPMDRPEWVAAHPSEPGVAYGTFTNNTARTEPDAANPRPGNRHGHILRWQNAGGDHGATTFVWSVFALAGAGLGSGGWRTATKEGGGTEQVWVGDGSTIAPADAFGSPDGLAFDIDGRLWIQTDGGQPVDCNNQMLAADPVTGDIRRFLVGPKGCEITGWTMTPDQRTLFINVQHPGEDVDSAGSVDHDGDPNTPPREAPAYDDPTAQSSWPGIGNRPRSATVAIRRLDGGPIGAA